MTAPPVVCQHCGRRIATREALSVVGRTLQPLHVGCYGGFAAAQPWYRKPGWPVNRWTSLLWFNLLLLGAVFVLTRLQPVAPERWRGLILLLVIPNVWLLAARLVSYRTLERHLPRISS